MKTTPSLAIAALAFVAATAAQAVEATRFEAPASWTNSRAEVQAAAQRAAAADQLVHGEAGIRFADPSATEPSATAMPTQTQRILLDRGHGHRNVVGDFAVGGM